MYIVSGVNICYCFFLAALARCQFFFDHYQFEVPVDCSIFPDSVNTSVCLKADLKQTIAQRMYHLYTRY